MKSYIVKSGQNLFDVAMTLYGSIEGIFDLLVSNQERSGYDTPLSYDTELQVGDTLNYNPEFLINQDVTEWFNDNNIKVKNGNHIYSHQDVEDKILTYVDNYNKEVLEEAMTLYPSVWDSENDAIQTGYSIANAAKFFPYIYMNYWGVGYYNVEYEARKRVVSSDIERASADEYSMFQQALVKTRMRIVQNGSLSSFTSALQTHTVLAIDWGDMSELEIYTATGETQEFSHCYEDDGEHLITLYGNVIFNDLDLSDINGIYYPVSVIKVIGAFTSKLLANETINQLITTENEQDIEPDLLGGSPVAE